MWWKYREVSLLLKLVELDIYVVSNYIKCLNSTITKNFRMNILEIMMSEGVILYYLFALQPINTKLLNLFTSILSTSWRWRYLSRQSFRKQTDSENSTKLDQFEFLVRMMGHTISFSKLINWVNCTCINQSLKNYRFWKWISDLGTSV